MMTYQYLGIAWSQPSEAEEPAEEIETFHAIGTFMPEYNQAKAAFRAK
jgi:hypothetical protein